MAKRLWLLGVGVLVLVGLLVACGSNYSSSSDGLVLVGSQGSGLIETFSFNLNSGHVSAIANSPNDTASQTCVLNGLPSSIVVDPAGQYAYTIINANSACGSSSNPSQTGIGTFKINSDGTITAGSSLVGFSQATITIQNVPPPNNTELVSVVPGTMTIDSTGKFLFVADRATVDSSQRSVPGAVSVFAIGTGGSLSEVPGSPFFTMTPATTLPQASFDIISVAATPTVLPPTGINGVQNAVCSNPGNNPPTSEYLYAVDTLGNQVFEFQVDTSSGVLTSVNSGLGAPSPAITDQVPVGVAVDPCDRFVYVSNSLSNKVSAYTICNGLVTQSSLCGTGSYPPGALVQVSGSPFSFIGSANGAGPLVVDPFGNFVYVLGTNSNTISMFKISPVSGSLTANASPVATGQKPTSIAIRSDDNWLFVTDYNSATVSQYSITPATGVLNGQQAIQTDNYPWGVAVK